MENDIKSCPFCGGKANIFIDNGAYKKYSVFCSNNNCCRTPNFSYRYLAIKLWNRRTAPAGMVRLNEDELIRLALEYCKENYTDNRDECDEKSGALIYFIKTIVIPKFASPPNMVPVSKKAILDSLGYPTNRILSDNEISLITYICDNFSSTQREIPSVEDIKNLIICGRIYCNVCESWDYECGCNPSIIDRTKKTIAQSINALMSGKEVK